MRTERKECLAGDGAGRNRSGEMAERRQTRRQPVYEERMSSRSKIPPTHISPLIPPLLSSPIQKSPAQPLTTRQFSFSRSSLGFSLFPRPPSRPSSRPPHFRYHPRQIWQIRGCHTQEELWTLRVPEPSEPILGDGRLNMAKVESKVRAHGVEALLCSI